MNTDRMRRYRLRTLTPPPRSFRATRADIEDAAKWVRQWERGEDPPDPPLTRWRSEVAAYAAAKGLRHEFTAEDHVDGSITLRWQV